MVQKNLQNKHVKARRKSNNEDVTAEFLPTLAAHIVKKATIDQLAGELGLSKVYDLLYRFGSLEVHGNTFGWHKADHATPLAINALLKVILLIVDNKDRTLPAGEILLSLGLSTSSN